MTVPEPISMKVTLAGQLFVNNSAEFHENTVDRLFADTVPYTDRRPDSEGKQSCCVLMLVTVRVCWCCDPR
jgi:hypothetical protein